MSHSLLPPELAKKGFSLRPQSLQDYPFLERLYIEGRWDETSVTGWNIEQREDFLRNQFSKQYTYYRTNYINPEFLIIEKNRQSIGHFSINNTPDEIRIIEISIEKKYRRKGIARNILNNLIILNNKNVCLNVKEGNFIAISLYKSLGFEKINQSEGYIFMVNNMKS